MRSDQQAKMFVRYACDKCGHLMSYHDIKMAAIDFGCPTCKNSFKNFSLADKRIVTGQ